MSKSRNFLLRGAKIVTPENVREDFSILIQNGQIALIASHIESETAEIIDVRGMTLFAGFVDVHNHGAVGVDCNAASAEDLHRVSQFLAKNGVTAWLPTLVPDSNENYQKAIRAIDELMATQEEREPAARVVGVHYEGPFVSEKQCGALRVEYFKNFARGDEFDLPRLQTKNARHLITVAPEITGGIELIKKLVNQNWIVAIGHTRAETTVLDMARAAGARHLTHFFNAMTGLHHRDVGVVGWALTNEETTFDIIADNIHVAAPMLRFAIKTKTPAKVSLISDSIAPTGLDDGDFAVWGEKISVVAGKTQNERGSIAGSVITIRDAARNLRELGFSAVEIAQMAAANPARLIKIEIECGSIEIGKRADLTAIDKHGNVVLTFVGGKLAINY
jgi:N-acetylglucosamine-6-phosphate deacetylase